MKLLFKILLFFIMMGLLIGAVLKLVKGEIDILFGLFLLLIIIFTIWIK